MMIKPLVISPNACMALAYPQRLRQLHFKIFCWQRRQVFDLIRKTFAWLTLD